MAKGGGGGAGLAHGVCVVRHDGAATRGNELLTTIHPPLPARPPVRRRPPVRPSGSDFPVKWQGRTPRACIIKRCNRRAIIRTNWL